MLLNTGYIAHLATLRPEHIGYMEDLTNRGFPCIISNYLNNGHEQCDRETSKQVSLNRCLNITNPNTRYFILFTDAIDDIALIELGIAIAADTEIIALIGTREIKNTFAVGDNITRYTDWDNFITRRFFA